MATIIEKEKNITFHCNHCGVDVICNIDEDKLRKEDDSIDTASLNELPQSLYKKYLSEIKEKFSLYQSWGYKKSVTKYDTALSCDTDIRIYSMKCPKCQHWISKKEIIKKKYYIRIYAPEEYPNAEDSWISISTKEAEDALKKSIKNC